MSDLNFFEILLEISKKRLVFLTIPETFIWNASTLSITLIYTNYQTEELIVKENISKKSLIDSIHFFEDLVKIRNEYPIAIIKTSGSSGKDACKPLFKAKEALDIWEKLIKTAKNCVLQRFIPSGWNASVLKCSYDVSAGTCKKILLRKNNKNIYKHPSLNKNIFSNVLLAKIQPELNKNSYCIRRLDQTTCISIQDQPSLDFKMEYLANILESHYFPSKSTKLLNLQANWIQDPKGNLFLINVKNYQMQSGHSNLVIDRPIMDNKKEKKEYSYNEMIVKRSLSPPYYFPNRSLRSINLNNTSNTLLILPKFKTLKKSVFNSKK